MTIFHLASGLCGNDLLTPFPFFSQTNSQINRELKRLQVEGELTSAAIHAIRCGNEQHTYQGSSHRNTGTSPPSENKKSSSDTPCDSHALQNPIPVHSCIAAHTLNTRQKLDNQYTCVCKMPASKKPQSNDEVLSTELSTLRRRQEALAERIEKLQVSRGC
ncbi:hypothetical protein FGIG_07476 [Fasciola gigantica]|uniref:Uncharacterized protein n=1 Tax=Fasciola gigantica TaxID=46835 RepID=A0A504YTX6_FASGI|nr:hypothetical protein FGIG_07476 [Fasciola gigantica]